MGRYGGERLECHISTYAVGIYTLWQFGSKRQHQQTVAIDGECQLRLGGIELSYRTEIGSIVGKQQLLAFGALNDIAACKGARLRNIYYTVVCKPSERCRQVCGCGHVDACTHTVTGIVEQITVVLAVFAAQCGSIVTAIAQIYIAEGDAEH